jgi:PTS system nitrogen regulatory IIA component
MSQPTFTLEELADYLHLTPQDVDRLLRESDIPHAIRGGRAHFERGEIDAWASRRILGMPSRPLDVYHEKSSHGTEEIFPNHALVPELLRPDYIELDLSAKTRASAIREMVRLAEGTGRVFDPKELVASVEAREALNSTAMPGGFALLHPRQHEPYRYDGSFFVIGRTPQEIPFGAPDGRPTRLFFLICCQDDRIHLHTLARLCVIALKTEVIGALYDAPDAHAAYDLLVEAEQAVLPHSEAESETAQGRK